MKVKDETITELAAVLRKAEIIVVLTGAGVSAESGMPTFRDALTGLWSRFKPEELATPEAFARDPETVARWYDERRMMALACAPNAGHVALAQMQTLVEARGGAFHLITQNIDRLHQRAGSRDVSELHGTLLDWRCLGCGAKQSEAGPAFTEHPPRCKDCGGSRRPDVVWFGEILPEEALRRASVAARTCDLFLSIGTSSLVYPAAGLIELAAGHGAKIAEINPNETPLSHLARWSIRLPSAQALPRLAKAMS